MTLKPQTIIGTIQKVHHLWKKTIGEKFFWLTVYNPISIFFKKKNTCNDFIFSFFLVFFCLTILTHNSHSWQFSRQHNTHLQFTFSAVLPATQFTAQPLYLNVFLPLRSVSDFLVCYELTHVRSLKGTHITGSQLLSFQNSQIL